jgi:hypothetical protein
MPVDVGASERATTVRNFLSVAIQSPAVFHAVMAKTRCEYEAYMGKEKSQANPSHQVLYHRGEAIRLLPNQLKAGKVDYGFVTTIITLMTIDVCSPAAVLSSIWTFAKRDIL